jgi:hypothetical protein
MVIILNNQDVKTICHSSEEKLLCNQDVQDIEMKAGSQKKSSLQNYFAKTIFVCHPYPNIESVLIKTK